MIMFTLGGELILVGPGLELDSLVMSRGLVFFLLTPFSRECSNYRVPPPTVNFLWG